MLFAKTIFDPIFSEDFTNIMHCSCRTTNKKVKQLKEYSKNKNIQDMYKDINGSKKGYQPCAYIIKKGNGIIVAEYN